ncbi:ATPase [Sulfitobacter aestuariivivens]|uniref:ATPase n=1 Tax=Sulfitobacter aestuariivivens TaxID=2766981 RepID=A0A927HFE1_9RHOB|nr:ATPase [Sulfitobacter aestuariivivens]MBD3663145.1 ATPase [Sulfitobacter aestuariivivens]
MLYSSAQDWRDAPRRKVLVFGMSGLGKTYLSGLLRGSGDWFHYSIDYRIGTRYLGERITDNAKAEAMKVPFLRDLLMTDSIYLASNITFENLSPVATWLGKPGDPEKAGLPMAEYAARQEAFRQAEVAALNDTAHFAARAKRLYGYDHFICDTGGSICEWVDPGDPNDPLLTSLSNECLLVWIKGDAAHKEELIKRFDRSPKPMAYQPAFLKNLWEEYLNENNMSEGEVDPDTFIRWTYARALDHRQPRYKAMAKWGVTVTADQVSKLTSQDDFVDLIATCLPAG